MNPAVQSWLAYFGLEESPFAYSVFVLGLILLTALVVHVVLHQLVFRALERRGEGESGLWHQALIGEQLYKRAAFTLQGIIFYIQPRIWMVPEGILQPILQLLTALWVLVFGLLSLYSLINAVELSLQNTRVGRNMPLRGL